MSLSRPGTTGRLAAPAEFAKVGVIDRDIEQAITALKKGATLLKYGRRGKPKFCPFKLTADENDLIWYSGSQEKTLRLSSVTNILAGQKTAVFQRYPRPDKEYQSFSLIYQNGERSLDIICKDQDEAQIWFMGLKALLRKAGRKSKMDMRSGMLPYLDSPSIRRETSPLSPSQYDDYEGSMLTGGGSTDSLRAMGSPANDLGSTERLSASVLAMVEIDPQRTLRSRDFNNDSDDFDGASSMRRAEPSRASVSSQVSTSSQGSGVEDSEALGDVYMWGEGVGDGVLGGGVFRIGSGGVGAKLDALLPKALESTVVLDVQQIACGGRHASLVNKQGEVFAWGEESLGRLGHGVDTDVATPQLVESLSMACTELVACGEYHTCAVTQMGELYTWGMGTSLALGHGNDITHWIPKRIDCVLEGVRITQVACGPWHTAAVSSIGQLFMWGDGTFGALGHGDRQSSSIPKEVDSLSGLRTVRVACGVWHSAAVVEVMAATHHHHHPKDDSLSECYAAGKIFTWGDGDKGRLGHGDKMSRDSPTMVASTVDYNFCQVACGHSLTVALSTNGQVFTCGSSVFGQLGNPQADGTFFGTVEGRLKGQFVEMIACGAQHVAVLTTHADVYTWGKGANGRLGHGDLKDREQPMLVEALKDKRTTHVACGASFTAVICQHKWVSGADHSICASCKQAFGFTRKRHNCYNCGLVFCHPCSSKKALKASLAPNPQKPYRVCDVCFTKLLKAAEASAAAAAAPRRKPLLGRAVRSRSVTQRGTMHHHHHHATDLKPPPLQGKVVTPGDLDGKSSSTTLPAGSLLLAGRSNSVSKRYTGSSTALTQSLPPSVPPPSGPSSRSSGRVSPTPHPQGGGGQWGGVSVPAPFNQTFGSAPPGMLVPGSITSSGSFSSTATLPSPRPSTPPRRALSPDRGPPLQMPLTSRTMSVPTPTSPRKPFMTTSSSADDSSITTHLKKTNEMLQQEINSMRAQVKELTQRCERLEAEAVSIRAEAKSQVSEALAVAGEETARANNAAEIIKSLSAQMKEMALRLPEGSKTPRLVHSRSMPVDPGLLSLVATHVPPGGRARSPSPVPSVGAPMARPGNAPDSPTAMMMMMMAMDNSNGGNSGNSSDATAASSSPPPPPPPQSSSRRSTDSNGAPSPSLEPHRSSSRLSRHSRSHGHSSAAAGDSGSGAAATGGNEQQRVEQVEPGVYITLLRLPNGAGNELRRVRFSRKVFSERQAEAWWAENRSRVHATYNIRGSSSSSDRPSTHNTPTRPSTPAVGTTTTTSSSSPPTSAAAAAAGARSTSPHHHHHHHPVVQSPSSSSMGANAAVAAAPPPAPSPSAYSLPPHAMDSTPAQRSPSTNGPPSAPVSPPLPPHPSPPIEPSQYPPVQSESSWPPPLTLEGGGEIGQDVMRKLQQDDDNDDTDVPDAQPHSSNAPLEKKTKNEETEDDSSNGFAGVVVPTDTGDVRHEDSVSVLANGT